MRAFLEMILCDYDPADYVFYTIVLPTLAGICIGKILCVVAEPKEKTIWTKNKKPPPR